MANLYGAANAPGYPASYGGSNFVTVSCPAAVYTSICTTPVFVAPSNGYFYALTIATVIVQTGASVPNNIFFACGIGNGAIGGGGTGVNAVPLTASGNFYFPATFYSAISQTAWQGAGSYLTLYCQPTVNAVTCQGNSWGVTMLLRAPDQ